MTTRPRSPQIPGCSCDVVDVGCLRTWAKPWAALRWKRMNGSWKLRWRNLRPWLKFTTCQLCWFYSRIKISWRQTVADSFSAHNCPSQAEFQALNRSAAVHNFLFSDAFLRVTSRFARRHVHRQVTGGGTRSCQRGIMWSVHRGRHEGHLAASRLPVNGNTVGLIAAHRRTMDSFDNLSASEKAEASELQRMIAVEQQKAQFQAQVCVLTDANV